MPIKCCKQSTKFTANSSAVELLLMINQSNVNLYNVAIVHQQVTSHRHKVM